MVAGNVRMPLFKSNEWAEGSDETYGHVTESVKLLDASKLYSKKYLATRQNSNISRVIDDRIPFKSAQPDRRIYRKVHRFHKVFRKNATERKNCLLDIYDKLGKPETLVSMFLCRNYFPLFHNWFLSCKQSGITVKDKTYDIEIMFDGRNYRFSPFYANTGFIFLRNTPSSRATIETAFRNSAYIYKTGRHQDPFNSILQHLSNHNVLNVKILPDYDFMNGHLFGLSPTNPEPPEHWRENGVVLHLSWTENLHNEHNGKYAKYKRYDLNFSPWMRS